jgi:hypothetical protein
MFSGDRFIKVIVGLVFMVFGFVAMAAGAMVTAQQKREAAREALAAGSA